jgi:hypothetical protein
LRAIGAWRFAGPLVTRLVRAGDGARADPLRVGARSSRRTHAPFGGRCARAVSGARKGRRARRAGGGHGRDPPLALAERERLAGKVWVVAVFADEGLVFTRTAVRGRCGGAAELGRERRGVERWGRTRRSGGGATGAEPARRRLTAAATPPVATAAALASAAASTSAVTGTQTGRVTSARERRDRRCAGDRRCDGESRAPGGRSASESGGSERRDARSGRNVRTHGDPFEAPAHGVQGASS